MKSIKIKSMRLSHSKKTLLIYPIKSKNNYHVSIKDLSPELTECLLNNKWSEIEFNDKTQVISGNGWIKIKTIYLARYKNLTLTNELNLNGDKKLKPNDLTINSELELLENIKFSDFADTNLGVSTKLEKDSNSKSSTKKISKKKATSSVLTIKTAN